MRKQCGFAVILIVLYIRFVWLAVTVVHGFLKCIWITNADLRKNANNDCIFVVTMFILSNCIGLDIVQLDPTWNLYLCLFNLLMQDVLLTSRYISYINNSVYPFHGDDIAVE